MTYKQDSNAEFQRDSFFRHFYSDIESKKIIYKKRCLLFLLLILIFFSYDSLAIECVTYRGGYYHTTYEAELVYFTKHDDQLSTCSDTVLMTGIEFAVINTLAEQNTQFTEITGEMASASFAFGMSTYLVFWLIGYKQRMAKQLIRQF
jgi:hypothetical protein